MALIEPYLQNSDDNEIRDILNSHMTDMDTGEEKRIFMKMSICDGEAEFPSHKTTDGRL